MKFRSTALTLSLGALLATVSPSLAIAQQAIPAPPTPMVHMLGHNLLANGGCESSDAAGRPTSWQPSQAVTCIAYGGSGASQAAAATPRQGLHLFRAEVDRDASADLAQTIDVSAEAHAIDAGEITFALSGLLGFPSQEAAPEVSLRTDFLGADGSPLGSTATPALAASDLSTAAGGLAPRQTTGRLPVGTRRLEVSLEVRGGQTATTAFADDLSLVLRSTSQVD